MKKYDIALLDLDGTLSESGEGILECVRKVFEEMKRPLPDEKTLSSFIGPPLIDSLKRCGFSEADAEKGLQIYKRNFVETGIYKNKWCSFECCDDKISAFCRQDNKNA